MTNPHKQPHSPTTYALTPLSQTKMALHAARHGTASSPVHGVLLGYRRRPCPDDDSPRRLVVVADAIPLCHEAPTKPLVEAALRIVEGYLEDLRRDDQHEKSEKDGEGDLKIVGWYTANAHVPSTSSSSQEPAGNAEPWEMPNLPAMKIASSMSESHPHDEDDDSDGDFVLALVSTPAWTSILNNNNNNNNNTDDDTDNFHMCHLFERSKSNSTATFAHPVPSSRISPSKSDVRRILSEALARVSLTSLELPHHEKNTPPLMIYDYVDHVSNFGVDGAEGLGRRDWLENREVVSFVNGLDVGKRK